MMYPFHWCHKPLETMSIWLVDGIALSCLHHVGGYRSLKLRRRSQCQTRHRPRRVAKQEQELPYLQTHLEGSGRSKLTDALGMGGWDDCYWIILYLFPPLPAKHQRETFFPRASERRVLQKKGSANLTSSHLKSSHLTSSHHLKSSHL